MVKCIPEYSFFIVFLKNRNISSKIKRSKVTGYAALNHLKADHVQPKTPLFTSDSQHPPRFRHAVYLGVNE